MRHLYTCVSPSLLEDYDINGQTVVVIDVLRATSSMCLALFNGAKGIIPVLSPESCLAYANFPDYILAAERNGEIVDGFDVGNSPLSYTREKVTGKTIVISTTNGTKAINKSITAKHVVVGSFLNLDALALYLKTVDTDVILLCSGWKNKVNLEDTLFAGALVQLLENTYVVECDSSVMAKDIYQLAKDNLRGYLYKSSHSQRLKELNIEADVQICLTHNIAPVVPILKDGMLIEAKMLIA